MDDRSRLTALLEEDLDTHLITLKFLGLFGERCGLRLDSSASGWASLVWFDAKLFPWDRQTYPEARFIVFLDGTAASLLPSLAASIPSGPVVFKSSDPRAQAFLEDSLKVPCVRRFLWYTGSLTRGDSGRNVSEVLGPDPAFDELLASNGYDATDSLEFWRRGARGYLAEEDGEPRAFCLAYPNHGRVWEVASVKTLDGHQRRGFASQVVRAAVHGITTRGHRVRYHVDAENGPSRALAESLGLHAHVEARHYAGFSGSIDK